MIRDKDFKNKVAISASRLDSYIECSARYAYRYLYKLPDKGNDGANRGSVSHEIFEVLSNKRHQKHVSKIIANSTCRSSPAIWKLVTAYAKKYGVEDSENLSLIDGFIVTGLKHDFYGPPKTAEILTEKIFDFEHEANGINYRLKGFIDKIYLIKDNKTCYLYCKDYKSSKRKFDKEKIEFNNQAIIYQLALNRYLFPNFNLKQFDFIFLKFADDPVQTAVLLNETQLIGYERWLTEIQKKLENFSERDVSSNFAANNQTLKITRCGKEGFKKTGEPYFICEAQRPFKYYALLDSENQIIKTSYENDLTAQEGEKVVKRNYAGCPYFFDQNGSRIRT